MSGSGVTPPQGLEVVEFERFACGTMLRSRVPQPPRECRRDEKSPVLRGLGHEAGFVTRMRVGLLGAPDADAFDASFCEHLSAEVCARVLDLELASHASDRVGFSRENYRAKEALAYFQLLEWVDGSAL